MSLTVIYIFKVTTAWGFEPTVGYMNVILKAPGLSHNVSLSSAPLDLTPFNTYYSTVYSHIPASEFNGAVFQWNDRRNSGNIKLKEVWISPRHFDSKKQPNRNQFNKLFCVFDFIPSGVPTTMLQC